MTDEKRDLTGILDRMKPSEESSDAMTPSNEGDFAPFLEETPIDKVDDFESLEDFGKSNPEPASHAIEAPSEPLPELQTETFEPPAEEPPLTSEMAMEEVKRYSEQIEPSKEAVPASFPFSILIHGELAPEEKARLLDLLSRENMGIRELDLEPQFASGKILIPRISEYAAILIVSALRSSRTDIRMGPSDSIFSTEDTSETAIQFAHPTKRTSSADLSHPAEHIIVTTEASLPGTKDLEPIDTLTASATLKTHVVETENSTEYQQILEALTRELKYKAYRKGAAAIVNFSVHLTSLHLPTQYRILLTGLAMRKTHPSPTH